MFNLGPYLDLREFDFATHLSDQALLAVLLIRAGPRGDRPDRFAVLMLRPFVHAGVTGITRDVSFFAVRQLIDLSTSERMILRFFRPPFFPAPEEARVARTVVESIIQVSRSINPCQFNLM